MPKIVPPACLNYRYIPYIRLFLLTSIMGRMHWLIRPRTHSHKNGEPNKMRTLYMHRVGAAGCMSLRRTYILPLFIGVSLEA